MTVSIIIPAYNAQDRLPRCIGAVMTQTYEDLQVILVDDGSTDDTPCLCDEAARSDGRIVVVHQENGGPPAARNAGLDAACGRWLMFVDADDFIEPEYVQMLVEAGEACGADLVVSDCLMVEGAHVRRFGHIEAGNVYENRDELFEAFLSEHMPWSLWGKLYDARLFEDVRFDENDYIAEDLDVNARIFAREGLRVVTNASTGYHYSVEEGSVDHSFTARHLCQFDVFERVVRLVRDEGICTKTSAASFYEERVLGCLRKALDARALTPEISTAFKEALAAHRDEVLADPQASASLKRRLRVSRLDLRIFGVFHRICS